MTGTLTLSELKEGKGIQKDPSSGRLVSNPRSFGQ